MSGGAQIIDAVVTRLATITAAGGYHTDAGATVVRNARALPEETTAPPFIVVTPVSDGPLSYSHSGARLLSTLSINIEGYVDGQGAWGESLADLLHDIRRAMAPVVTPPLGGLAQKMELGVALFDPPDDGGILAMLTAPLTIIHISILEQ